VKLELDDWVRKHEDALRQRLKALRATLEKMASLGLL